MKSKKFYALFSLRHLSYGSTHFCFKFFSKSGRVEYWIDGLMIELMDCRLDKWTDGLKNRLTANNNYVAIENEEE